jgi:dienelactone hydrolase
MVLGFCIAGPFIWNLLKRAPNRVVAAVPAQPVVAGTAERPL